MTAVPNHPDLATVQGGDIVTWHAALWKVRGFWVSAQLVPMADLMPLDGATAVSAPVAELTVVDRPVDTRAAGTGEVCS